MKRNRFVSLFASVICGSLIANSYCESIEMLKYGGFEELKDGMPVGWQKGNSGVIGITDDAFHGKHSATFKAVLHEWGFSYFSTPQNTFGLDFTRPGIPVVPGATYEISMMARGKGNIGFLLPMSSRTDFLQSIFSPDWPLAYEWRKYIFKFKIENPRALSVLAGIKLSGLNAEADIDNVSMTFDPVENPGINPGFSAEIAKNNVTAVIESSDADAVLYVNGKTVTHQDGKYDFELIEGYNAIAIEAFSKGSAPAIRVSFPTYPEANNNWRAAMSDSDKSWNALDFDDSKWASVVAGKDGLSLLSDGNGKKTIFRQVILWNKTHYGSNRCILPQIREWGFSPDTVETFVLALYSAQKRPFSSYEFVFELPEGFRLLDITKHQQSVYNKTPEKVLTEKIKRDNQNYTRYTLFYPAGQLDPSKTQYALLPVKIEKDFKENSSFNFYFHRKINGNISELCQRIPIVIFPAVNGKQPKKIAIQQYVNMQVYSGRTEPEHIREVISQSAKAGLNQTVWPSSHGNNKTYYDVFRDAYKKDDIRLFLWPNENFPLYGMTQLPKQNPPWLEWMKNTPDAQARYFNNDPEWKSSNITYFGYMYCPSYVIYDKTGKESFESLLTNTYSELLRDAPEAQGIWLDWETHVWLSKDNIPGKSSWCFCDKCKKHFKTFANIPENEELSDNTIMQKYHDKWIDFRSALEGEIQGVIVNVCKKMKKSYMIYAESSNKPFWKACKGNTDMVFSGLPGNAAANSFNQKQIDDVMAFYRKDCEIQRVIAQRFSYPDGFPTNQDGWKTFASFSDDGFVNAKSWKSQIIRLVATCQGGIDICNGMSYCGGMLYYLGEATRIISEYEDLFYEGKRQDNLAESEQIKYPNLLVMKKEDERLVLLFNETSKPIETELINKNLKKEQVAFIYGTKDEIKNPEKIRLTVPAGDVIVIHIKNDSGKRFLDSIF